MWDDEAAGNFQGHAALLVGCDEVIVLEGKWQESIRTLLTTSSESSSGGMWVMVPQVRVSMREVLCISRDSPKSATFAVMPC